MNNAGIIRNRLKIGAAIVNAKAFIETRREFGTFYTYLWGFTGGKTIHNKFRSISELPTETELSHAISEDLKQRGFKFVGSKVVYAHMQATGMVNDHLRSCFRYKELVKKYG
jgi:DNA-3-methyladenine glycosylase I